MFKQKWIEMSNRLKEAEEDIKNLQDYFILHLKEVKDYEGDVYYNRILEIQSCLGKAVNLIKKGVDKSTYIEEEIEIKDKFKRFFREAQQDDLVNKEIIEESEDYIKINENE